MMSRAQRRTGPRRGANMLEFALCLLPYLYMMGGALDYAWFYHHRNALDYAAYVGCRAGAMVEPNQWGALTYRATAAAENALEDDWVNCPDCEFTITSERARPMRDLRCAITGTYQPLVGLVPTPDLVGRATVRMEIQQ